MTKTMMRTLAAVLLALLACGSAARSEDASILVQSTTSTENSGLFGYLLPKFKEKTGIEVRVVAVGTGQALKNAQNGDGDVVFVHAKADEEKFVAAGWGVKRFDVMYNDFIIVGPASDPVGIAGSKDAVAALTKIAAAKAAFASRGDDSGTHKVELKLWKDANVDVKAASGTWYLETGSGMGPTLNTAIGKSAYCLTDRGTWIAFGNKADYRVLVEGDNALFNQYGVILVNPEKHKGVKAKEGQAFIDWLIGKDGQKTIADYKINGQQLFFPNAGPAS
jgi:tungstate transport system substrate-binding protein